MQQTRIRKHNTAAKSHITRGYLHHLIPPLSTAMEITTVSIPRDCTHTPEVSIEVPATILAAAAAQQGKSPAPETITQIGAAFMQQEFDFNMINKHKYPNACNITSILK